MMAVDGVAAISPRFLGLLAEEGLADKRILDLGTGWGRLALALAGSSRWVVGLDRDAALLARARQRAREASLGNVEFHEVDVEREEYDRWQPDVVTAHLCVSAAAIERAARALKSGACLALVAFHVDQWRETGRVSQFAHDEQHMEQALARAGFRVEVMEVEREEQHFASAEEALAAVDGFESKWRTDGRWSGYRAFVESGGRTLTRSHLIVRARRR